MHEKVTLVVAKLLLPTHYVHIVFFCRLGCWLYPVGKIIKRDRLRIQVTYKALERFFGWWSMEYVSYKVPYKHPIVY